MWTKETLGELVEKQRTFFRKGTSLDVAWRLRQLKKLRQAIISNSEEFYAALGEDLSRSPQEAHLCDVGPSVMEINEMIRGLKRWARPDILFSGATCFPSILTKVHKMPYGTVLIISPFNFPVLLSFGVLAAAIAGGNTAVLKTSSKSSACTKAIKKLIEETFPPEYVAVVDGDHSVGDLCLAERFDKIFYTGSPKVGKRVMSAAAEQLTPVALELGGETGNWCVIRKDADLKDAARKIAFFKLCNSGQVCININQIAVAEEVAESFLKELKAAFVKQVGEDAPANPEYARLISAAAYDRCAGEADSCRSRIVFGGWGDREALKYAPTVIYPVNRDEDIVSRELFSPLLPVVPYKDSDIDSLMDFIASREHGLALYLFTRDKAWASRTMASQQYGGGCINEVCLHLMVKGAPFNGTGHSGMGAYHGVWGFREFTHPQTVLYGSRFFNLPLREHPYSGKGNGYKLKLLKLFER